MYCTVYMYVFDLLTHCTALHCIKYMSLYYVYNCIFSYFLFVSFRIIKLAYLIDCPRLVSHESRLV